MLAEYYTTTQELTSLADAIRTKGGTSSPLMYPAGFISAINDMSTGGGVDNVRGFIERTQSEFNVSGVSKIASYAFYSNSAITLASFPDCYEIGSSAFYSCENLSQISFPNCSIIYSYAFARCSYLSNADFPNCSVIGFYAFYNVSKVNFTLSFPKCTTISSNAFMYASVQNADFPIVEYISNNAFNSCSYLQKASFPKCSIVSSSAFYSCIRMSEIYLPICSKIGRDGFRGCQSLTSIYLPSCLEIGSSAFANCTILSEISLPCISSIYSGAFAECDLRSVHLATAKEIGSNAFFGNKNLTVFDITYSGTLGLYSSVFYGCEKLESVYFRGSSVAKGYYSNLFLNTPITESSYLGYYGSIYVPSSLLTGYQTSTHWSYFSDRFVGI